eukprot:3675242-Amphidinium_carterae.1
MILGMSATFRLLFKRLWSEVIPPLDAMGFDSKTGLNQSRQNQRMRAGERERERDEQHSLQHPHAKTIFRMLIDTSCSNLSGAPLFDVASHLQEKALRTSGFSLGSRFGGTGSDEPKGKSKDGKSRVSTSKSKSMKVLGCVLVDFEWSPISSIRSHCPVFVSRKLKTL